MIIWEMKELCSTLKYGTCVGRNFDYEISYKEQLIRIPKNKYYNKYDIIGIASGITEDFPLMYDGMNEKGLVCCGLAFNDNAYYVNENDLSEDKFSVMIKPYEFVFGILSGFSNVKEVKDFLRYAVVIDEKYSDELDNSDLHWFIADENESIIVEQTKKGLNYYDGNVMTNNPPYQFQKKMYDDCKKSIGKISFKGLIKKSIYNTRGLETLDLNGDYTSFGRFQRLSWLSKNLKDTNKNFNDVSQTFHLLSSVEQIFGSTPIDEKYEYTIYNIVYDIENLKLYVKMYDDIYVNDYDFIFNDEERIDLNESK